MVHRPAPRGRGHGRCRRRRRSRPTIACRPRAIRDDGLAAAVGVGVQEPLRQAEVEADVVVSITVSRRRARAATRQLRDDECHRVLVKVTTSSVKTPAGAGRDPPPTAVAVPIAHDALPPASPPVSRPGHGISPRHAIHVEREAPSRRGEADLAPGRPSQSPTSGLPPILPSSMVTVGSARRRRGGKRRYPGRGQVIMPIPFRCRRWSSHSLTCACPAPRCRGRR